jgi:hypothetical protein
MIAQNNSQNHILKWPALARRSVIVNNFHRGRAGSRMLSIERKRGRDPIARFDV